MKIVSISLALIVMASCSPTLNFTHITTNESVTIKAKKINAIITRDGRVYEEDIRYQEGLFSTSYAPIPWNSIARIEYRQTRLGDAAGAPLRWLGKGTMGLGLAMIGLSSLSDQDNEPSYPLLLTGFGLTGGGLAINQLGRSMRTRDSKAIKSIDLISPEWMPE